MELPTYRRILPYLKTTIAIIAAALLLFVIVLGYDYLRLRREHRLSAYQSLFFALHTRTPATADEVASLQTWMTFDYIDHVFALPPSFLQSTLRITDNNYPHITIAHYARDADLSSSAALSAVQSAIRTRLSTSTPL